MLAISVAAILAAAIVYYHGWFWLASLLGLGFAATMVVLLPRELGHTAGWIAIAFLVLFPTLAVAVHAFDAKHGRFLLPTIYSIPLAFAFAIVDLLIVVVAIPF